MWKKYWSLTLKPIQGTFLEVREKEQQKTMSRETKTIEVRKWRARIWTPIKKGGREL